MRRSFALLVVLALAGCGEAPLLPSEFDTRTASDSGSEAIGLFDAASATTASGGDDGVWAQATDWSTCVSIGDLKVELRTYKLLRVQVQTVGEFWREKRTICSIANTPLLGQTTVFPEKLVAALAPMTVDAALTAAGAYQSSFEAQLIGVKMESPLSDPMPLDANDPRVIDTDGDGKPGGTLLVGTLCEVYQANRARSMLKGTRGAAGRIEGGAVHSVSQVFLGGTSAFCTQPWPTLDNHAHHRFAMVKALPAGLDADGNGDVSCAEIIAGQAKVMAWQPADDKRCTTP